MPKAVVFTDELAALDDVAAAAIAAVAITDATTRHPVRPGRAHLRVQPRGSMSAITTQVVRTPQRNGLVTRTPA